MMNDPLGFTFDLGITNGSSFTIYMFGSYAQMEGLVLADINGDSLPDVVTPTRALLNQSTKGQLAFATAVVYGTGLSSTPAAADLDGDGRADVVEWTQGGLVSLLSTSH